LSLGQAIPAIKDAVQLVRHRAIDCMPESSAVAVISGGYRWINEKRDIPLLGEIDDFINFRKVGQRDWGLQDDRDLSLQETIYCRPQGGMGARNTRRVVMRTGHRSVETEFHRQWLHQGDTIG
jgi:hypothetical protein